MFTYVVAQSGEQFKQYVAENSLKTTDRSDRFRRVSKETDLLGSRPAAIVVLPGSSILAEFRQILNLAERIESHFNTKLVWSEDLDQHMDGVSQ